MNQISALLGSYPYAYNKLRTSSINSDFRNLLSTVTDNKLLNNFKLKYNVNTSVKSVGKDNTSISKEAENCRNTLYGFGGTSIIIAPNILKEMETNPKEKQYVESTINDYFSQQPALNSWLAAQGKQPLPGAIIFHADGTWTETGGCEPTPKKLAEIKKEQQDKNKSDLYDKLYYRNSSYTNWNTITSNSDNLKVNDLTELNNQITCQFMCNMLLASLNRKSNSNYNMLGNNLLAYSLYNRSNLL